MAQSNGLNPTFDALTLGTQVLTAAAVDTIGNSIRPGIRQAVVTGVATDANDWIVLPSLATVPIGHQIVVAANAGANFEVRTPATSGEKINNEDCDGTKELLVTDTTVVTFTKKSSTNWISTAETDLGARQTAVIPD